MSAATLDPRLVSAVGVTLIHFLWQGALIAALLGGVNLALRRASANLRYAAGCVALLLMFVAPITTFLRTMATLPAVDPAPLATTIAPSVPTPPAATPKTSRVPRTVPPSFDRVPVPPTPTTPATPDPAPPTASVPTPPTPNASDFDEDNSSTASSPVAVLLGLGRRAAGSMPGWLVTPSSEWLGWLVALWSLGVGVLSLRLLGGWVFTQRLRHAVVTKVPEALEEMLARLAARLHVERAVRIGHSLLVEVPTVVGWLKPVILLPASTLSGLTPRQLEAVLAHELAHIRRHDYLVNLFQTVIETLLFYHPAVWWVSRQVRDERENCCDDVAVAACGDALLYARALCELEELRASAPALAMAATGGSLVERIRRVLGARPARSASPSRWVAGAFAMTTVMMLVMIAGFRPATQAIAQSRVVEAMWPPAPKAEDLAKAVEAVEAVDPADPVQSVAVAEPAYLPEPVTPDVRLSGMEPLLIDPVKVQAALRVIRPLQALTPEQLQILTPQNLRMIQMQALLACKQAEMAGAVQKLSREQVERLAQKGVDEDLVRSLEKTGVKTITVDQLLELPKHGVDADFIEGMADAGYSQLTVDDLVAFANHGVTPEYVQGMAEAGCTGLSSNDLINLANHGVTPEWVGAMQFLGYGKLSAEQLIQLSSHGVDTEYVSTLRAMGYRDLTVDDLLALSSHGVTPDYVAELWGADLRHVSAQELVQLRDQGVQAILVSALRGVGYSYNAAQLIQLTQHGVDPEYVLEISGAGLRGLKSDDWVRLHDNGVDGRFVSAVMELRGDAKPSELIQMKQSGAIPSSRSRQRSR
jgi:beta-lactamase regulating signal transducer with metallopeptidase domain